MKNKKIIEILVGTNNDGKLREIIDLLPNFYKIYSPKDYKIKSPKENGKSFFRKFTNKSKILLVKNKKNVYC